MFQGSLLVIVMMLTAAKSAIMKATFELQSSVYSPIPKCINFVGFHLILPGCKSKNFCATSPYAFDISKRNHSNSYCTKPDVNIPDIFDRFHPLTSDFQNFDEVKILKVQINF